MINEVCVCYVHMMFQIQAQGSYSYKWGLLIFTYYLVFRHPQALWEVVFIF